METWQLLYIVIVHFTFDWILQPRWMAKQKTKSTPIALIHGIFIGVPLFVIFSPLSTLVYILIHAAQDRFLYNILGKLWDTGDKERNMVNHVAIDQMLHGITLILITTYLTRLCP